MAEGKATSPSAFVAVAIIAAAGTIIVAIINRPAPSSAPSPSVLSPSEKKNSVTASTVTDAAVPTTNEGLKKAIAYYSAHDYGDALPLFREAADAGDATGMSYMGMMYENGRGGVPKDDAQALDWYRKAAHAGNSSGMYGLGLMYEDGRGGLPKDDAQALDWYRKAAEKGVQMAWLVWA